MNRHGGQVSVASTLGKGATFYVLLPAEPRQKEGSSHSAATEHHGFGPVLVMDDDGAILEVLEGWLTGMGYTVTTCRTGSSALERFEAALTDGHPYRAVVLDLTVPGNEGGGTVLHAMRRADPTVALLVASGYSEDPVFSQPQTGGFTARIAKPFLKQDLARVLESCLKDGRRDGWKASL